MSLPKALALLLLATLLMGGLAAAFYTTGVDDGIEAAIAAYSARAAPTPAALSDVCLAALASAIEAAAECGRQVPADCLEVLAAGRQR